MSNISNDSSNLALLEKINKLNSNITGYGTNNNGYYWKFSDGTLICAKAVTATKTLAAWGALYESEIDMDEWPHPFISIPLVVANTQESQAAIIGRINNTTITNVGTVLVVRPDPGTFTFHVVVVGFGRWK